jgi:hypothetical protein
MDKWHSNVFQFMYTTWQLTELRANLQKATHVIKWYLDKSIYHDLFLNVVRLHYKFKWPISCTLQLVDFRRNATFKIGNVSVVDVYQLMGHVMRMTLKPHNGTWENVCDGLANKSACDNGRPDIDYSRTSPCNGSKTSFCFHCFLLTMTSVIMSIRNGVTVVANWAVSGGIAVLRGCWTMSIFKDWNRQNI